MDSLNSRLFPRLELKIHPDSVLQRTCMPVEKFDSRLADITAEMVALMHLHEGIGLAAPQVGLPKRFFVAEIDLQLLCLINPIMINRAGCDSMKEGCLSLPDVSVKIERNTTIDVGGYDLLGRRQTHRLKGLWARVVQHEMDHLDGILICDHSPSSSEEQQK